MGRVEKREMSQPFLKWAGGKRRLIPQYLPYIPREYRVYHEPFLGGGAMFFHLQPARAILSDINLELINSYIKVRNTPTRLLARLSVLAQNHSEAHYYEQRALNPDIMDPYDRAARFIYLNWTCFNGLYRENKAGQFNVSMGNYSNPKICQPDVIIPASRSLRDSKAICVTTDFKEALGRSQLAPKTGDFVFLDPPYYPLNTRSFTQYNGRNFGVDEHVKLREEFQDLVEDGVKVMLTNSDCEGIRELYKDYRIIPIKMHRCINSRGTGRGAGTEVLILGNCPE